ncbi:MAG: family transcriptional regulator [Ramlibacter sp.]|nr:family transcriptional regulator [Ramlibacter sp.]
MRHKKPADPAELRKRLGRAIAERRKAKGLTQDDLAGTVEVDAETVSRIERGSSLPSLQRLLVIAEALDAGVGELLSEASPLANDRAHSLVVAMAALGDSDQRLLLDFSHLLRDRSR